MVKNRTIEWINKIRRKKKLNIKNNYDIIIQIRKDTKSLTNYFKKANICTNNYGAKKRAVRDLDKLQDIFTKYNVKSYLSTTDGLHLFLQIYPYINKKNIILGHGAGMVFTLFMENNSKVIEILPHEKIHEFNWRTRFNKINKIKI